MVHARRGRQGDLRVCARLSLRATRVCECGVTIPGGRAASVDARCAGDLTPPHLAGRIYARSPPARGQRNEPASAYWALLFMLLVRRVQKTGNTARHPHVRANRARRARAPGQQSRGCCCAFLLGCACVGGGDSSRLPPAPREQKNALGPLWAVLKGSGSPGTTKRGRWDGASAVVRSRGAEVRWRGRALGRDRACENGVFVRMNAAQEERA